MDSGDGMRRIRQPVTRMGADIEISATPKSGQLKWTGSVARNIAAVPDRLKRVRHEDVEREADAGPSQAPAEPASWIHRGARRIG